MAREISAGAVVFKRNSQIHYLLLDSGKHWDFPKGNLETNETAEQAALREVREETGLDVNLVAGFKEKTTSVYRKEGELVFKEVIFFLGEAETENVVLSWEHKGFKWLESDDAMALLKHKGSRDVLEKAKRFLEEWKMQK
jgi:bis(5'-nucleosidyl)-tetraphosphatase